jgi:hypothetical protein
MAQSFAGRYRLCEACLDRAAQAGAIERIDAHEKTATVFARTYAWLKLVSPDLKQPDRET